MTLPNGKVIPMNEVDQLKAEVKALKEVNLNQELQMMDMTMALIGFRRPMVLAQLKSLEGEKNGPSSN